MEVLEEDRQQVDQIHQYQEQDLQLLLLLEVAEVEMEV
jgi:hypothetical protein|tara:strand:- start:342 stop:455 length:114 start_codon:yes stop_codon:yes gene_type:complete